MKDTIEYYTIYTKYVMELMYTVFLEYLPTVLIIVKLKTNILYSTAIWHKVYCTVLTLTAVGCRVS